MCTGAGETAVSHHHHELSQHASKLSVLEMNNVVHEVLLQTDVGISDSKVRQLRHPLQHYLHYYLACTLTYNGNPLGSLPDRERKARVKSSWQQWQPYARGVGAEV